ncbi:MAG: DEAD/DEAH box helicase [Acidimicrobiia bacterium]|nr:DEAD/DEAH box helicase [Acidimicrobiia bacterium]
MSFVVDRPGPADRRDLVAGGGGLDALLDALAGDGRLVHVERLPARPASYAELATPLRPLVRDALGVEALWSHQAAAIDNARAGRSVAVATGTASGKSLCFRVPIAEVITDPIRPGTALLVFPTKALARDQLRALADLELPGLVACAYDGDCSNDERAWARKNANVILTNPEMLHSALLPHHSRWATFLLRLRYVVVDELHAFRGVFGSHVAHVLRRLRRLAALHGATPTFIGCSASVGEPGTLASGLWGGPVEAVTDDGSPRGERLVALWRPPRDGDALDPDTGREARAASAHAETAGLLAELVGGGHRAIGFCRSRRVTEVVALDVRRRLGPDLAGTVRSYRGGYLPAERREIEDELFTGGLRAVVTTNALELGIDVGGLDACVLDGFPGTVASFWQQAGRAGRECQQSLAVLVAGDDQLDQWLMRHPRELFTRPAEPAVINPGNPYVLGPHLACAAFERPLTHGDERWWPELLDDGVRDLARAGRLKVRRSPRGPAAFWAERGFPAHGVGLRSGSAVQYRIARTDGAVIGTVEEARAFELVHPSAVYLHQGVAWRVADLRLDEHLAVVEPDPGAEFTMARTEIGVRTHHVDAVRTVGELELRLGWVEVESQVTGYQRRAVGSGEVLGRESLDLPASRLTTRAFWYRVPEASLFGAGLEPDRWPGTLHAVEHAAIGILPLFTICDRWDVGGVSTLALPGAGPAIVIYDAYPGGAGVAELGFEAADRHLAATLDVVGACRCADGCPSCVQSPKCGNWNEPLDKDGAARLLRNCL